LTGKVKARRRMSRKWRSDRGWGANWEDQKHVKQK